MKPDLVEYLGMMSDHKFDNIEEIIDKKYRKFISFFELVRERSDQITDLKYNLSDEDTLDVTITMTRNVKESINEEMKQELEEAGYTVITSINKKKLSIILQYEE